MVRSMRVAVAIGAVCALVAGCGAQGSSTSGSGGGSTAPQAPSGGGTFGLGDRSQLQSIKGLCGTKPVTVALADGFGENSWRKIALAELRDEASKCPNVKQVLYTDAGGDPQKAQSDINGLVARGANVLIVFPDAGPVLLPALRKAYQAGVTVIPYNGYIGGRPGTDYTTFVGQDHEGVGAAWGAWMARAIHGRGKIVYLGGVPGNPSSLAYFAGVQKAVSAYPGISIIGNKPVDTNWDPAQEQRAMSGLLAQYPDVAGVISDYGVAAMGVVRAFQNANRPMVPLAVVDTNGLSCLWRQVHKQEAGFQLMSVGGTSQIIRLALRKGIASFEGTKDTEPFNFPVFVYEDTLHGKPAQCDTALPPDAALSSALNHAQLAAAVR